MLPNFCGMQPIQLPDNGNEQVNTNTLLVPTIAGTNNVIPPTKRGRPRKVDLLKPYKIELAEQNPRPEEMAVKMRQSKKQ